MKPLTYVARPPERKRTDGDVRLLFVGDVSLTGAVPAARMENRSGWERLFRPVRPVFDEADVVIGNLESPLHISDMPARKNNILGTQAEAVTGLTYLGFDVLGLSNNHITDQGSQGVIETRTVLMDEGIAVFGAGENLQEANREAIVEANGIRFAFLGYVEDVNEVGAVIATEDQCGCVPLSLRKVSEDIARVRRDVDHVVVSLHWGYQFDRYPSPSQVSLARSIIDAGATVVHGHHPHVLQAVERHGDGLIMYSLGNFFFPDFVRADGVRFRFPAMCRETMVVTCVVNSRGVVSFEMIPLMVGARWRVGIRKANAGNGIIGRQRQLAKAIGSHDYPLVWKRHHEKTVQWRCHQLEEILRLKTRARKIWETTRNRGWAGALAILTPRGITKILRLITAYVRVLFRRTVAGTR